MIGREGVLRRDFPPVRATPVFLCYTSTSWISEASGFQWTPTLTNIVMNIKAHLYVKFALSLSICCNACENGEGTDMEFFC